MELFSFLEPLRAEGFPVAFVSRVSGVMGSYQKEECLSELEPTHRGVVEELGFQWSQLWRAEQVHGAGLAAVGAECSRQEYLEGVDGLMTGEQNSLLGIYVADCGLIWVADRGTGAVALLHSGRKGTEAGIFPRSVSMMSEKYGSKVEDLLVVLGPCIRPPHYEVDIASLIAHQAREAGVGDYYDCGICTGSEVDKYYSYRIEKGLTGRMLGLLAPRAVR